MIDNSPRSCRGECNRQQNTKQEQNQSLFFNLSQKQQQHSELAYPQLKNISQYSYSGTSIKQQQLINQFKFHQSKLQSIIIQSQLRKINNRIILEQQFIKNKKMMLKLQEQIKKKQNQFILKKRILIKERMENLQKNKKQREIIEKNSNRVVKKLKILEERKQLMIKTILTNHQKDQQQQYDKKLEERKKLLIPMNFLSMHTPKNNNKNIPSNKTLRQKIQSLSTLNDDINQSPIKYGLQFSSRKNKKKYIQSSRIPKKENCSIKIKISSDQHMLSKLRGNQQRVLELKRIRQKSQQYGDMVQKQYYRNKPKIETVQLEKIKQREVLQQNKEKQKQIFKKMKKPNLPFEINAELAKNNEIKKISQSNCSPQQKLIKLNQMSQIQLSRVNIKGKSADIKYLTYLNNINMVRAAILLEES